MTPDLALLIYGRTVDATITRCSTCGEWTIVGLPCGTCPTIADLLHPLPNSKDAPCPER